MEPKKGKVDWPQIDEVISGSPPGLFPGTLREEKLTSLEIWSKKAGTFWHDLRDWIPGKLTAVFSVYWYVM